MNVQNERNVIQQKTTSTNYFFSKRHINRNIINLIRIPITNNISQQVTQQPPKIEMKSETLQTESELMMPIVEDITAQMTEEFAKLADDNDAILTQTRQQLTDDIAANLLQTRQLLAYENAANFVQIKHNLADENVAHLLANKKLLADDIAVNLQQTRKQLEDDIAANLLANKKLLAEENAANLLANKKLLEDDIAVNLQQSRKQLEDVNAAHLQQTRKQIADENAANIFANKQLLADDNAANILANKQLLADENAVNLQQTRKQLEDDNAVNLQQTRQQLADDIAAKFLANKKLLGDENSANLLKTCQHLENVNADNMKNMQLYLDNRTEKSFQELHTIMDDKLINHKENMNKILEERFSTIQNNIQNSIHNNLHIALNNSQEQNTKLNKSMQNQIEGNLSKSLSKNLTESLSQNLDNKLTNKLNIAVKNAVQSHLENKINTSIANELTAFKNDIYKMVSTMVQETTRSRLQNIMSEFMKYVSDLKKFKKEIMDELFDYIKNTQIQNNSQLIQNNTSLTINNDLFDTNIKDWLTYIDELRGPDNGILDVNFGWDSSGVWFTGDAGQNTPAYPIFTNFTIPGTKKVEITVNFIYDDYECKNFGLCVYLDGVTPEWIWEYPNKTRIAAQYDYYKPGPCLSGTENTNQTVYKMRDFTTYTCHFTYDPNGKPSVILETLIGNMSVDTKSIYDVLPPGDYRIGFTADNDIRVENQPPNRTYIENLLININDGEKMYRSSLKNISLKKFIQEFNIAV